MSTNPSRRLCRHFLRGNCCFGTRCRFFHDVSRLENATNGSASTTGNTKGAAQAVVSENKTLLEQINSLKTRLSKLSADKTCGICLDVVREKQYKDRRFGLLPNCTHIYCLKCIGQWRHCNSNDVDKDVKKCCPECRVYSEYICPSEYYADKKEDKDIIINNYRVGLSTKDCRNFRKGRGRCPFGNKCFYRHALRNGTLVDLGEPVFNNRRQNNGTHQMPTSGINLDAELMSLTNGLFHQMLSNDELLDLIDNYDHDDVSVYDDFNDDFDYEDEDEDDYYNGRYEYYE